MFWFCEVCKYEDYFFFYIVIFLFRCRRRVETSLYTTSSTSAESVSSDLGTCRTCEITPKQSMARRCLRVNAAMSSGALEKPTP